MTATAQREHRTGRWLLVGVGLIIVVFELITIVGVGVELVRHGPSARNRVFGGVSLVVAAGAVGVLSRAAKQGWLPKATGIVAVGLIGVFLIAIAPSGV